MTEAILQVTNLSKSFGDRRAVDAVSFRIEKGQTLGLIGPNGAGKSTTASMICGVLRSDSGEILINGQKLESGSSAVKQLIGLVPQELAIYEELSARENLKLFGSLYGLTGTALKVRCNDVLALVNLSDRAADKPSTLSGGMKRRLNIAAALLHDPQLLILDEPTVGVDPQSRNAIFDSLETLKRQGRSLIYTSHYMEEVERLADHIVIIDHGKVIVDEPPALLYRRLPAQAALSVDFALAPSAALVAGLSQRTGVKNVQVQEHRLNIALAQAEDGLAVLQWLVTQGFPPVHYVTAKASLEDIFLTLTGRSLRD
jgi:ABC-2 type transport system ATP-binding protein